MRAKYENNIRRRDRGYLILTNVQGDVQGKLRELPWGELCSGPEVCLPRPGTEHGSLGEIQFGVTSNDFSTSRLTFLMTGARGETSCTTMEPWCLTSSRARVRSLARSSLPWKTRRTRRESGKSVQSLRQGGVYWSGMWRIGFFIGNNQRVSRSENPLMKVNLRGKIRMRGVKVLITSYQKTLTSRLQVQDCWQWIEMRSRGNSRKISTIQTCWN